MDAFYKIYEQIKLLNKKHLSCDELYIPSLWDGEIDNEVKNKKVRFTEFLLKQFDYILGNSSYNISTKIKNKNVSTIYNLFVRYGTAFDHYNDNQLKNTSNRFKESGTFLKAIAILPYLKSLGIDTLYLLPITSIGQYCKKGNAGSPYSIYNPYQLDENLSEPLLELSVDIQFRAIVEAAHCLGMKVICEFIFRTASKDSSLALEHPEWFYWIKEECEVDFTMPKFSQESLTLIKEQIENKNFNNLPEPTAEYQRQFTETPIKIIKENEKIIGFTKNNQRVTIPNAFADWPPDDIQAPWTDVTYLKLYNDNDFNYIAYNTIRMLDNKIKSENTPLWRYIENIIPYYQKNFGIDGAMIDMGHALPDKLLNRIIDKTKNYNEYFIIWQEKFFPNENNYKLSDAKTDLITGYIPLIWNNKDELNKFIYDDKNNKHITKMFSTTETHNTIRTATNYDNNKQNKEAYIICKSLNMPTFILNGFELNEIVPINPALNIDKEKPMLDNDSVPLFNYSAMNWLNQNHIVKFIQQY